MCGIAGQVGRPSPQALERALLKLDHRGPDQRGTHYAQGIALGHTRLSVLDLSEDGRQPMTSSDARVRVTFNGEIYNHRDLRAQLPGRHFRSRSDTEVLVHGTTPAVSTASVLDYLVNTYIPAHFCIFEGIHKLAPASLITVRRGSSATVEPYWTLPERSGVRRSEGEWLEAADEALGDSVKRRLEADVPVGAFLSGGIDSSLVVAAMAEQSSRVVTLSMGFEGEGNELPHARAVARHFGTQHHEHLLHRDDLLLLPQLIWHFGEPFGDHAALPNWLIAQAARREVTVVLTGDGGDETFGGYLSYPAARLAELVHRTGVMSRVLLPEPLVARLATTRLRKLARVGAMAAGRGSYRLDATGLRGFRGWIGDVAGPRLRPLLASTRVDAQRDALWMLSVPRPRLDPDEPQRAGVAQGAPRSHQVPATTAGRAPAARAAELATQAGVLAPHRTLVSPRSRALVA